MDEYISKKEAIIAVTHDGCTANVVGVLYHLPPADVAPRAEVEKLQEVNADLNESLRLAAEANKDLQAVVDRLRFNLKAVLDERAEDKAVVAREIFEEIASKQITIVDHVGTMGVVVLLKDIFELKKKYTGG